MRARRSWPYVLDVVGPRTPGLIRNRLSIAQVETIQEAVVAGVRIADIAALTEARRGDVIGCLIGHGLLAQAIANAALTANEARP